MAKVSKTVCDANIRKNIFDVLNIENIEGFVKVNDRQYGCIMIEDNGTRRYARIGVIVTTEREDVTADDMMASEIQDYNDKQAAKQAKAEEKAAKIASDKAKREKAKAEKEAE